MSNKSELRPVGAEFDYEFQPDRRSTDPRGCIIRYKVVEHVECEEYGRKFIAEKLEPIKITYLDPPEYMPYGNL